MEFYGSGKKKYILAATPFKKGGEGSVYEIIGYSNLVAKIYHAKVVTDELEAKIKYVNNNPPAQSILNQIAWPQDYLTDSTGNFVGFVMPKLHIDVVLEEIYAYPPNKINISTYQKVVVAINICRVISEIHKAGYTFGDFNPCNIGVNLSNGNVAFLDTDSYHIYDKNAHHMYRCVVCRDGYVAPELIKVCKGADYKTAPLPTFTQETDRFALAIHIFKLLFNGFTPYNGILETERSSQASPGRGNEAIEKDSYCFKPGNKPMSSAVPPLEAFPQEIQDLFTRAFIVGRYAASMRPTAEEWDAALVRYLGALVQCGANPLHHFYNNYGKCPYCEADANYKAMLQSKAVYGTSSQQMSYSQPVAIPSASQSRTGSWNSGSSTTSSAINRGKRNQAKTGFRKKFRIALIIILCVLFAGAGTGGGIYYKISLDKINETTQLISYLPTGQIEDYSLYGDLIFEAYDSYSGLAEWQKEKVENRETLLNIIPAYNEYTVEQLRETAAKVTVDTVAETDYLASCVEKYNKLTQEQKAMLSAGEINKFENFIKVKQTIENLSAINEDLLNRYGEVNDVTRLYYSISAEYQELVYNYYLVDTFAERVSFYDKFVFTQMESGGYAIQLKDGETLEGDVELPSTYNGADVTTIPEGAFYDCRKLTSVVVPDTVQTIGKGAFERCNRLQSMTLPFTGKSASAEAYEAVFGFIFGYTTQNDGGRNSSSRNFINTKVGNVDGATWQYSCNNGPSSWGGYYSLQSYYYYIPASLTKVTITKQTSIAVAAFNGGNHLEHIKFLSALRGIGDAAFQSCNSLTSFNSDEEKTIDLDGEIENIGSYAFFECEKITDVLFNDENLVVGNHAFDGCSAITELNLPSALRTIGDYAFKDLVLITDLVVHDSTLTIGVGAFNGCKNLTSVTLPFTGKNASAEAYEAVFGFIFGYTTQNDGGRNSSSRNFINTKVGNVDGATWQYSCNNGPSSWGGYYSLQSYYYYIPATINTIKITNQKIIQIAAFNNCKNIESIRYEQEIETLSGHAFQDCLAIKRFNSETDGTADLSGTYLSVGNNFLRNCTLINKVILPAGIVAIGEYAFENISVSEMEIPDSVESIYIGAFKGCDQLQSITLPFVGKNASAEAYEAVFGFIFGYTTQNDGGRNSSSRNFINTKVGNVDGATWQYSCNNGPSSWGGYYSLQSYYYYIPASLTKVTITKQTSIAVAAFNGCSNLADITFQMGLTGQGDCAFQNCTAEIHDGRE